MPLPCLEPTPISSARTNDTQSGTSVPGSTPSLLSKRSTRLMRAWDRGPSRPRDPPRSREPRASSRVTPPRRRSRPRTPLARAAPGGGPARTGEQRPDLARSDASTRTFGAVTGRAMPHFCCVWKAGEIRRDTSGFRRVRENLSEKVTRKICGSCLSLRGLFQRPINKADT